MKNIFRDIQGFTLVEMAIVLVIVGLLVGLGTSMIGPMMSLSKTRETKEFVGAAVESVNSWAASNNRIPPFTPAAPDTARFDQIAKSPVDSWGRNIIYIYDANLAPTGAIATTKDTICGRKTTALTIINNSVTPAATINNVALALFSQGDDATTQTRLKGKLNGVAIDGLITGSGTATGTITLDANVSDIVRWVTLDELRSKIGCQGAQLKIVNNELPPATVGAQYPNATTGAVLAFTTDGGATPGTSRWCLEAPNATPLPAGLAFTPAMAGAIRVAPNTCNAANPLAEASWISSPSFTISGTPAANSQGAYNFTIFVRDNNDLAGTNDNIASKAFVLTVNPQ